MRKGFLIPYKILKTNYYTWILNPVDKCVFQTLGNLFIFNNNKYYNNGLAVVNASEHRISMASGIKNTTLSKSIDKLDQLGVIVKSSKQVRNNKYLIGFRNKDDDIIYLIDHLIREHEDMITDYIEEQMIKKTHNWQTPNISDKSFFKMNMGYKEFIRNNINDPHILSYHKLKDNKTLYEILFDRKDIHKLPLAKTNSCDNLVKTVVYDSRNPAP